MLTLEFSVCYSCMDCAFKHMSRSMHTPSLLTYPQLEVNTGEAESQAASTSLMFLSHQEKILLPVDASALKGVSFRIFSRMNPLFSSWIQEIKLFFVCSFNLKLKFYKLASRRRSSHRDLKVNLLLVSLNIPLINSGRISHPTPYD